MRESKAYLYNVDTYFLGKSLAELPLFLVVPVVWTMIAYPMIGLKSGFFYFAIATAITALIVNVRIRNPKY